MASSNFHTESRYAWFLVIVASMLMGMGGGALISISTFLKPISTDFGWLRGQTSFAYMAGTIAMGIGGIVMGHLSDRFGTRSVVIFGLASLGWSLLLLGTQSKLCQFYLYYCMPGGIGASTLDAPLLANVGRWFERNKGLGARTCNCWPSSRSGLCAVWRWTFDCRIGLAQRLFYNWWCLPGRHVSSCASGSQSAGPEADRGGLA